MPKRGSVKMPNGEYVSMNGSHPSGRNIGGSLKADLMRLKFAMSGTPPDPLDDARLAYWSALPLEEVKWAARVHKVRIESKTNMACELAFYKHLPEDPANAPLPSTKVELVEEFKDFTGKVISKRVISPKGEPIVTQKKTKRTKRVRPY